MDMNHTPEILAWPWPRSNWALGYPTGDRFTASRTPMAGSRDGSSSSGSATVSVRFGPLIWPCGDQAMAPLDRARTRGRTDQDRAGEGWSDEASIWAPRASPRTTLRWTQAAPISRAWLTNDSQIIAAKTATKAP